MIGLEDCIAMCGLEPEELAAICQHHLRDAGRRAGDPDGRVVMASGSLQVVPRSAVGRAAQRWNFYKIRAFATLP